MNQDWKTDIRFYIYKLCVKNVNHHIFDTQFYLLRLSPLLCL